MSDRQFEIEGFLRQAGWAKAEREAVLGDASTRSYERLFVAGKRAILMNAPKGAEMPGEPDEANPEERKALGYNATARLAGPNIEAFICLAHELKIRGFSAPEILAVDGDAGLLLLEDFGANIYARMIAEDPSLEADLYFAAVDTLAAIYRSSFSATMQYGTMSWRVRDYDETALLAEIDLCLDWYAKDLGHEITTAQRDEFYGLWREAFESLNHHASGLCLRDFHAENLFWLPDRDGTANVGLIDFQDALFVHPAYDLVSFIEDARREVSLDLTEPLKQRFCEKAGLDYNECFHAAYAVMGAQRNTKVIGFPVRADLMFGKPQYRTLIPAVRNRLQRDLEHPALANIKRWYSHHIPQVLEP